MALAELAKYGDELVAAFGGGEGRRPRTSRSAATSTRTGSFSRSPYISTLMGEPGTVFRENMVFGVEAFLATLGVGSAGYEDNNIITKTDAGRATTTPPVRGRGRFPSPTRYSLITKKDRLIWLPQQAAR